MSLAIRPIVHRALMDLCLTDIMGKRIVGLPMYDAPEIRAANTSFWHALAAQLHADGMPDVPHHLTHPDDLPGFWSDPDLLFGQTCGYPFTHHLCGQAELLATPVYDVEHVEGPRYGSAIIVAESSAIHSLMESKDHIVAINGYDSNTGMNLLRISLARAGARDRFFSTVIVTGAHRASLKTVIHGKADIAAIDVVSLAHFKKIDPDLSKKIRIIAYTPKTPGLPFITSGTQGSATIDSIRNALFAVIKQQPRLSALETLMLKDVTVLPRKAYDEILALEDEASALGYPYLK